MSDLIPPSKSESESELRGRYFHTLKLDGSNQAKIKRALTRAYSLRTFEIEHYWKRAAYFWTLQGAIFIALGVLWKERIELNVVMVALSGLGILTALANYLAAKGSKFWQENWESHIDMLEDDVEGRLHKTIWLRGGMIRFSVSRVNECLNAFFVVFWIVVAVYIVIELIKLPNEFPSWAYAPVVVVLILIGALWLFLQVTDLKATLPDSKGNHTQRIETKRSLFGKRVCSARKPQDFVRRYAPDEFP